MEIWPKTYVFLGYAQMFSKFKVFLEKVTQPNQLHYEERLLILPLAESDPKDF